MTSGFVRVDAHGKVHREEIASPPLTLDKMRRAKRAIEENERRRDRQRAWAWRAHERAKAALKPGDKLRVGRCGGGVISARFVQWDGFWACSPTLNDLSPAAIVKVNGKPVDFTNGEPRPA